jgi:DNA (cytosine-5)-methyltransferase 1
MNPYTWLLTDLEQVPSNGIKVMSTFACGGGSSLGYKLAGCDVIAANDIDPEMAWHYKANLHPRHYFLCPIRDLLSMSLPPELYQLDILDGSPPCSTFSMSGNREHDWGREKHFREGQTEQVLSDLFFDYLDLVSRLRPKVGIAENVKGMLLGNAKGYTKMVFRRFKELGYRPQLFLVNAADCGVPQRRERVFFCAVRNDLAAPRLELSPRKSWVTAGTACSDLQMLTDREIEETKPSPNDLKCWYHTRKGHNYSEFIMLTEERVSCFNNIRLNDQMPANTLPANDDVITHWNECRRLTLREWKRLGSFPDDYVTKTDKIGKYIIGMSVPPRMMETVARAICMQWLRVP